MYSAKIVAVVPCHLQASLYIRSKLFFNVHTYVMILPI